MAVFYGIQHSFTCLNIRSMHITQAAEVIIGFLLCKGRKNMINSGSAELCSLIGLGLIVICLHSIGLLLGFPGAFPSSLSMVSYALQNIPGTK